MQKVWSTHSYYEKAEKGSMDLGHPGMKLLINLSKSSKNILDLGCGEGTRLRAVGKNCDNSTGVDVSALALKIAAKNNPKARFIKTDLTSLPFKDSEFDLVYSAYVFEHLTNPNKSLKEAVRVTRKNLVIMCPNYGSPNRSSPNYKKSRFKKLINGTISDFSEKTVESWEKVKPSESGDYRMDNDTTVEPYILSLLNSLKQMGMSIKYWDTCWGYELPNAKIHQRVFRILANLKIFPFKYWGPHMVVHAVKS
jgi:ubiquinone/menaquinone biosynthesis C-methylase UbiE